MDVLNQALKDMNSEDINDEMQDKNNENYIEDTEVALDKEV